MLILTPILLHDNPPPSSSPPSSCTIMHRLSPHQAQTTGSSGSAGTMHIVAVLPEVLASRTWWSFSNLRLDFGILAGILLFSGIEFKPARGVKSQLGHHVAFFGARLALWLVFGLDPAWAGLIRNLRNLDLAHLPLLQRAALNSRSAFARGRRLRRTSRRRRLRSCSSPLHWAPSLTQSTHACSSRVGLTKNLHSFLITPRASRSGAISRRARRVSFRNLNVPNLIILYELVAFDLPSLVNINN
jgi:hypothetical protein